MNNTEENETEIGQIEKLLGVRLQPIQRTILAEVLAGRAVLMVNTTRTGKQAVSRALEEAKATEAAVAKQRNELQQKLEFEQAQRAAVEKKLHAVEKVFSVVVSANLDLVQKLEVAERELKELQGFYLSFIPV